MARLSVSTGRRSAAERYSWIERTRVVERKQWNPSCVTSGPIGSEQKKSARGEVRWQRRERLFSFDHSRLALSPIKTISRALIGSQSGEGCAHERGELKERSVSLQNPVCPSPFLTPFAVIPLSRACSRFHFLASCWSRSSPFRSRARANLPSFSLRLSIRTVSLNRQQHPSGPSHPRLQALGGNVYVSPASIILIQPPINRIQARRIAEYRRNMVGRDRARPPSGSAPLGSGSRLCTYP